MAKNTALSGRIQTKRRRFEEIARDYRHAVFGVVRIRQGPGGVQASALGSGFFVSSSVFLTCHHVINDPRSPHVDGDIYHLVGNFSGTGGMVHTVVGILGQSIFVYPHNDSALIISKAKPDQPFVSVSCAAAEQGQEIGVAGYPLPQLQAPGGNLTYGGMIYRVGRGAITAVYDTGLQATGAATPVLEVNFLFVSGNSGGPIFRADNGMTVGFVHGFNAVTIMEDMQKVRCAADKALHGQDYIRHVTAIYSLGLTFGPIQGPLQQQGVTLR